MEQATQAGERFLAWLAPFSPASARIHIVCDADGDGLPAGAVLARALRAVGFVHTTAECRRKGESAWGNEVGGRLRARLAQDGLDGLIVTDLGSRAGEILPGVPLLLVDHHHPIGQPPGSTLITSYGTGDPAGDGKDIPTSGLLAWWCARALCGEKVATEWLWLAGISLLSDLGDKAPFAELTLAKKLFGAGVLRAATSLLNAPRRTADGRADVALRLLEQAGGPKEISAGEGPEAVLLQQSKAEVAEALAVARKQPPRLSRKLAEELGGDIVAIRMNTACQVHPLVAQQWRGRFPQAVVFGVNTGYRPGWVSFSGRAPAGINLIEFLARHRPPEADTTYGLGHNQASGGSLPVAVWNRWIQELGFGAEMIVDETLPAEAERTDGDAQQPAAEESLSA